MKSPLISIIVPVFNSAPYLIRCLESLRAQTYDTLEIILIDDGSTDGSAEMCDQFSARDSRFHVIHQKNQGASAARNSGLQSASGDWIGFVDSDDWAEADLFSYLLENAYTNKADIVQCGLYFDYCDHTDILFVAQETYTAGDFHTFTPGDWSLFSNQVYNKLYHRSVISNVNFNQAFIIGEDFLFNLSALKQAERVTFCALPKYHYIQRPDSLCHKIPEPDTLFSYREAISYAVSRFNAAPIALEHLQTLQLKNNLDICSKATCMAGAEVQAELRKIRAENRNAFWQLLCSRRLTGMEKLKLWMTGYVWQLYRLLIRWKKGAIARDTYDQRHLSSL